MGKARQPILRIKTSSLLTESTLEWPAVDDDLLRTLPPVLRAVVRALGFGRARYFLESRGGAPVWVPAHKKAAWGLTPDEMDRLRQALQSHLNETRRITLPKVDKLFLKSRNEEIARLRGVRSVRDIAQDHALTTRQVMNIFRQAETWVDSGPSQAEMARDLARRQTDLFL